MTKSEEVIEALLGDCTQCDGTYIETKHSLASYLAFDSLPGDEKKMAWTCCKCGSTVFRAEHERPERAWSTI